jgi:hypothetical protein
MGQAISKQKHFKHPRIQRVFARATATTGFRGLSASQGGFLLLLFFARQRKVRQTKG